MFKEILTRIKAKSRGRAVGPTMTEDYIRSRRAEFVKKRKSEYEEAVRKYGANPDAKNYLIILKCRVLTAESIKNEFDVFQELIRIDCSLPKK